MNRRAMPAPSPAVLSLLAPFGVYLAGVALLGDWIIDDAGISYAYARNLAAGHGLVSQPGRPPVEGFSNFLWVIALTPLFLLRLFEPVYVVKALGAAAVLGAFALIQRALRRETSSLAPGFWATMLAAAAPPLVIWSASGLENGLTMLLVAAMFDAAVTRRGRWAARCGLFAALLGMTHPDGVIYALFGVIVAIAAVVRERGARLCEKVRALGDALWFFAAFAALFAPFMAFRLAVFGLPLPHTYYAKRAHSTPWDRLQDILDHPGALFDKLVDLGRGTLGPAGPFVLALSVAATAYLAGRRRLPRYLGVAVALQVVAICGHLWMDADWMGEYRFATAAVMLSIVAVAGSAFALARERGVGTTGRRAEVVAGLAVLVAYAGFFPRTVMFAADPPAPFAEIDRSYAKKLDVYADQLGLQRASVLLPDVGAMLYFSRLTVYDAAGLCDPFVVHTLKRDTHLWLADHPEFHDAVLDEIRPTFISTHHFWTYVTDFERDPRFARDYVAIESYVDGYVQSVFGRTMRSGDFVRRDALPDVGALARLRGAYRPAPRPKPLAKRLEEAARELAGPGAP